MGEKRKCPGMEVVPLMGDLARRLLALMGLCGRRRQRYMATILVAHILGLHVFMHVLSEKSEAPNEEIQNESDTIYRFARSATCHSFNCRDPSSNLFE
jgi:hypothetical protein